VINCLFLKTFLVPKLKMIIKVKMGGGCG